MLIEECEEFGLVDWEWQAADSAMGKARLGGDEVGPNPTDRAKKARKRHFDGSPRWTAFGGCGRRQCGRCEIAGPNNSSHCGRSTQAYQEKPQHLCLDKGYDNPSGEAAVEKHHYTGHIRRIGEEKLARGKKSIRLAAGSWKGH